MTGERGERARGSGNKQEKSRRMKRKRLNLKQADSRVLMACLIGLFMIWELPRMLHVPRADQITWWIQIGELILVGAVLGKIRYSENRWIFPLILGLILIFLTSAIRPPAVLEATKPVILRGLFIYLLCPAVGILLTEKDVRKFLTVFIAIWVGFFTVLSAEGIYSMHTGITILDSSGIYGICNEDGHLNLNSYYTVSAANLAMAILMAVIGINLTTKKIPKVLYVICILIMQYALALTTGRAGMFATGIGLGITAASWAEIKLRGRIQVKWKRVLVLCCVIVIVTAGIYPVFMLEESIYNGQIRGAEAVGLIPGARAEGEAAEATEAPEAAEAVAAAETAEAAETTETVVAVEMPEMPNIHELQTRTLWREGLSGRGAVYRQVIDLIREKPYLLLTGTSVPLVMEYVNKAGDEYFEHVHCMPLQILLETGIWGLGLLILFLIPFLRAAWKLFFATEEPGWKRLIFLPTICMFCIEMIECILRLKVGLQVEVPVFLFYGLTICLAKTVKEPA